MPFGLVIPQSRPRWDRAPSGALMAVADDAEDANLKARGPGGAAESAHEPRTASGAGDPILVFQMAKVASVSWYDAIRTAAPQRTVQHFHYASPATRALVAAFRDRSGPTQTIARPSMFRIFGGFPPELLLPLLDGGRWSGGPVRLVCGIRDPVARAASILQHGADYLGHTGLALTEREGAVPQTLVEVFRRGWSDALGDTASPDSFAQFLAFGFGHYRTWFAEELQATFGLDVTSVPFDRTSWCARIAAGEAKALVYRVEDLGVPERLSALLDTASKFLDVPLTSLDTRNAAEQRRSRDLYRLFRSATKLPSTQLDRIYAAPILHHFYDEPELTAFRRSWT